MADERPLFVVKNRHGESSGNPPFIDGGIRKRYHGYFENEYGEQAVFVYDYEVGEGTLWMGDVGWETPYKVTNGEVPELLLGQNETSWLKLCWETAISRPSK